MEDFVNARIFKIDAQFVRNIKDMGFDADNFEHLVKTSSHYLMIPYILIE